MRKSYYLILLLIFLLLTLLITSNIGAVSLTWQDLWHTDINSSQWQIWLHIHLPRLFLALIVGLALACIWHPISGLFIINGRSLH